MVDTNPMSEVRNADWHLGVERTYVLLPEIFDTRISGNEIRLLLLLRYRASGRETNFVSYKTLAEDLCVHENSIKNWMKNLKDLGYVTCSSRGFAASSLKTITSMVERYDKDILLGDRKTLVGSKRTPDMLAKLHCKPLKSTSAQEDVPMGPEDSHRYTDVYPIGTTGCTPQVHEVGPEIDKEKIDKVELDSQNAGEQLSADHRSSPRSGIGFSKGEPYDLSTGEMIEEPNALVSDLRESKGETAGTPDSGSYDDDDGATRRAKANALIARKGASADRKSREVLEKRRAKKDAEEASGEAEIRRRLKKEMQAATKKEMQTVKSQIEEHIRDTYRNHFPDARMGKFTRKEYGQLNSLIDIYEGDVEFIKKAWTFLCEGWDELKRNWKIDSPVPTISLFLGFRESIFSMVQKRSTARQEAEKQKLSGQFDW